MNAASNTPAERERIADEMEHVLLTRTLGAWFPRCIEDAGPFGGFHERYDRAWNALPDPTRSLVFAARMTWVCATMAEGGFPGLWHEWAESGLAHLRDRFHAGDGRFHWQIDLEGVPSGPHAGESVLYGHAFAIFALAAAARVLPDSDAPAMAREAFGWYERAHRDPEYPGSFEIVDADARPGRREGKNDVGGSGGRKSQNSPLHLLEALAELARVDPNDLVRTRLRDAVRLLTETMFRETPAPDGSGGGRLEHETERDGTPVDAPATWGHDVEAGHLVLAAEALLGERTPLGQSRSRLLIRTALADGFSGGALAVNVNDAARISWVQSENLLALATLLAEGEDDAWDHLLAQWAWIRDRQVDAEHGGLFGALSPAGDPLGEGAKGGPWKAAYHDTRALLYSARLLRGARVGEDPDADAPRGY